MPDLGMFDKYPLAVVTPALVPPIGLALFQVFVLPFVDELTRHL